MENFHPQPKPFVVKFNEYLKNINEKPVGEGKLLQYAEQNQKEFIKIQAILANDRVSRQVKEIVAAGLAEELNEQENTIDPYDDDFYYSNLENGYRIQSAPVYDDTMKIASHRYIKTPVQLDPIQQKHTDEINIKYEKEYNYKFRREQEANDKYFQEKVAAGEMTFIGQMTFDEYIELVKKRPAGVSLQNFELVPCFEGDNEWWSENNKVYGYTANETATQ